ncbi:MAG: winged helix DNA-binding protein [Clostridia bacterium]|nr:winged helix DNA-binding protein [Clostridia bacterium]
MMTKTAQEQVLDTIREMYDCGIFSHLMDLCQGEFRTLYYLNCNINREIIPSMISTALNVSRGRTTATLTLLREKGYITMEISPADRRRMLVKLTDMGITYTLNKQRQAERYVNYIVDFLGEENSSKLINLFKLITNKTKLMENMRHEN